MMLNLLDFLTTDKGGSGSGNWGHEGRTGKIGGSAPSGSLQGLMMAGMSPEQLFAEQIKFIEKAAEDAMAEFQNKSEPSEMTEGDFNKYLERLGDHRRLIMREAIKISNEKNLSQDEQEQLRNRVLAHDADKYDWRTAEAYVGSFKLSRGTYEGAFTAAMNAHHLTNDHHWEYWQQNPTRAVKIPKMAYMEMMADWRGTAAERGTPIDAYYRRFGKQMILHPETRKFVEQDLGISRGRR